VANELNGRPRKTLGWDTPAQAMAALLSTAHDDGVAPAP
jgi:transposase, IS30 family